jgi:hypothetical protein
MHKEVNFELAKSLKEKGFDNIDCNGYYHVCDGYTKGYAHCYSHSDTQASNAILAPTIAEVVMWCFNTHKIWITVDININGKFTWLLRQFNPKDIAWEIRNPTSIKEYFNNPDDAYSSGISYFLNNLEMSK